MLESGFIEETKNNNSSNKDVLLNYSNSLVISENRFYPFDAVRLAALCIEHS